MAKLIKPRLGIIGCGAVVQYWHLPALKKMGWRVEILIDRDRSRAEALAKKFKARSVAEELDASVFGGIDAALVATPHAVRADVCVPLLENGINILLEKPVATTVREAERIAAAATASAADISIGYVHRNSPIREWTTAVLRAGLLGEIASFDVREGTKFGWDIKSPALWDPKLSGGGVLMDQGTHTLDLIGHWFGDVASVAYKDDAHGGVEAEAMIDLKMKSGARGVVELSRTRELTNRAVIEGSAGRLVVSLNERNEVIEAPDHVRGYEHNGVSPATMPQYIDVAGMFHRQLGKWLESLVDGGPPPVPITDGIRSVSVIQKCYKARTLWDLPWVSPGASGKEDQARWA